MRVLAQPTYVLHTRDYRDSSLLVELLTPDYGRVSGVVKGVRAATQSARRRRAMLQPFVPLLVDWSGKTDLKSLLQMESCGPPLQLQGHPLFSAIYVNELITRLVHHYEVNKSLFVHYQAVITSLAAQPSLDVVLRRFELWLLQDLGYGVDFTSDCQSGEPLDINAHYFFDPEMGFLSAVFAPNDKRESFLGRDLLAIADDDFDDQARRAAKAICRQAIAYRLGGKPLKSRELFR